MHACARLSPHGFRMAGSKATKFVCLQQARSVVVVVFFFFFFDLELLTSGPEKVLKSVEFFLKNQCEPCVSQNFKEEM